MSGASSSPFWTFSLRYYAGVGVPAACLTLQDGSGVDVNVLLFALYAARCGRRLSSDDIAGFIAALADWKDRVVAPLRGVRRALKDPLAPIAAVDAEALRNRIKAMELEAERLEQEALYACFPLMGLGEPDTPVAAARHNVVAQAKALGATFDLDAVNTLIAAFEKLEDTTT